MKIKRLGWFYRMKIKFINFIFRKIERVMTSPNYIKTPVIKYLALFFLYIPRYFFPDFYCSFGTGFKDSYESMIYLGGVLLIIYSVFYAVQTRRVDDTNSEKRLIFILLGIVVPIIVIPFTFFVFFELWPCNEGLNLDFENGLNFHF